MADSGQKAVVSVVVPAHNEEQVIGRCLNTLLEGLEPGQVELIVACNGCTDATAAVAAAVSPDVRIVETAVASKDAALNLGDAAASVFPRVFLDADIELGGRDLLVLARVLEQPDGPLAAMPEMRVDLSGCSWMVRAYYRVWQALPYSAGDSVGGGVYALSSAGRARFDQFPGIVSADDHFVNGLFPKPGERQRVPGSSFTMHSPLRVWDLVKVLWRRRAAILEYERLYGTANRAGTGRGLTRLARRVSWWPSLAIYGLITLASRAAGRWKFRVGDLQSWERDETTRKASELRP